VRHFLEVRHVLGLNPRHAIELRIVNEVRESLSFPLGVHQPEYPRLC